MRKASVSRGKRGKGAGEWTCPGGGWGPWTCWGGAKAPQQPCCTGHPASPRPGRPAPGPAVSRPHCPQESRHCWQCPGRRPREQGLQLRLTSATPLFLPPSQTLKRVLSVTCAGTGHEHGLQTSHFKLFIAFHHSPK